MNFALGIDIGGTFTDVVVSDEHGRTFTSKVLSTPDNLAEACLAGAHVALATAGIGFHDLDRVVHATTQGTNAVLERKRPAVPFLITEGFRDLLAICGSGRTDLYDLMWQPWLPPTSRELTWEVPERMGARGEVVRPLEQDAVRAIAKEVAAEHPASIAVCLLHAYAHPEHEQHVGRILREELPETYVALSSEVWPEHREYQRSIATVLSAYIGPVMAVYLSRLEGELKTLGLQSGLHVMQSNGGSMSVSRTIARPLHSLESGPAAGALAAGHIGKQSGFPRIIGFDMGGTTAKASLIVDGQPRTRGSFNVGGTAAGGHDGVELRLPVLDLVEVGAGGGSVAKMDAGGVLAVGPESAGADPGPACYGRGGTAATVTDANLLLGYLSADYFLGGSMPLDPAAAEAALRPLADTMGCSIGEAAARVHDIVNLSMEEAIRLVSIARGVDPRDYVAMGFGGAGPTHIARLAEAFDIDTVVIPRLPGVFSTVGLLASDLVYEETKTLWLDLDTTAPADLDAIFDELERGPIDELEANGFTRSTVVVERSVDLRRKRQSHDMNIPVDNGRITSSSVETIRERYSEAYERLNGIRRTDPLDIQACRVRVSGLVGNLRIGPPDAVPGDVSTALKRTREVYFRETAGYMPTPVYDRIMLAPGMEFDGPAIIEELESTTVVPPDWSVSLDVSGNLILRRRAR